MVDGSGLDLQIELTKERRISDTEIKTVSMIRKGENTGKFPTEPID